MRGSGITIAAGLAWLGVGRDGSWPENNGLLDLIYSVIPKLSDFVDADRVPLGSAVRMGRRNLFAGRRNGSRAAQILPESPGGLCPTTETADAACEEVIETPGASAKPAVSFAAAHADGRPQRALPQKPKLESLNLGNTYYRLWVKKRGSSPCYWHSRQRPKKSTR